MAVVCNPIRMGRWSELLVVCVCHSDEVMRKADANNTSGELGSAFPGILAGESVFRTANLEILIESISHMLMLMFVQLHLSEITHPHGLYAKVKMLQGL